MRRSLAYLLAGIVAATVSGGLFVAACALSVRLDPSRSLGVLTTSEPSASTWLIAVLLSVALYGAAGIGYGATFRCMRGRASPFLGAALGCMHAGVLITLLTLVPSSAPGVVLDALGPVGIAHLVAAHVGYGAIVGAIGRAAEGTAPLGALSSVRAGCR